MLGSNVGVRSDRGCILSYAKFQVSYSVMDYTKLNEEASIFQHMYYYQTQYSPYSGSRDSYPSSSSSVQFLFNKSNGTKHSTLSSNITFKPSVKPQSQRPFVSLTKQEVNNVKKFVFFIGYPRSGHSIIGSYLDAHPNVIIAHEYPLFKNLLRAKMSKFSIYNYLYKSSYDELINGWRGRKNIDSKGYSLSVEGLWQATFDKLTVIGNKQGGATVQLFRRSPRAFFTSLNYLQSVVNIPILILHVIRNPFDMISTQTLYMHTGIKGVKAKASEDKKFNDSVLLKATATDMMERAAAAKEIMSKVNLPILEIHHEDLIKDPISTMKYVCGFIGIECSSHYLDTCKNSTYVSYSKSRHTVVWPRSIIDLVTQQLDNFYFFQRYSYSN